MIDYLLHSYPNVLAKFLEENDDIIFIRCDSQDKILDCSTSFTKLLVRKEKPVGEKILTFFTIPEIENLHLAVESEHPASFSLPLSTISTHREYKCHVYTLPGEFILLCNEKSETSDALEKVTNISNEMSDLTGELSRKKKALEREIDERKYLEDLLKDSLREKEILLNEIHHRVKNNFQIIISLISLKLHNVSDKLSVDILRDIKNRIWTMSLLHENIYQSENIEEIDFSEYIQMISKEIHRMYIGETDIQLNLELEPILLNIEQAIPCGLILNELLMNTFKHAFTGGLTESAEVTISLHQRGTNQVELVVSDNGVGIPNDFNLAHARSLGLQLVQSLSERQLKGTIALNRNNGTSFILTFNKEKG